MQNEQDDRQKEVNQMNSLIPQQRGEILNLEDLVGRTVVKNLILEAMEGMKSAYAPYSHYKVGAAILTAKQKVYRGCNVENAAYGSTNCAERTAIFKAISEGERDFVAIAVVGGKEGVITELFPPCGTCRQVMREFVDPKKFLVIIAKSEEDYSIFFLEELLPLSFGPENL